MDKDNFAVGTHRALRYGYRSCVRRIYQFLTLSRVLTSPASFAVNKTCPATEGQNRLPRTQSIRTFDFAIDRCSVLDIQESFNASLTDLLFD
jgi:hypothetical protein